MNIKTLKATVHTFKDWELKELRRIMGNEELTKQHIVQMELARRKKKTYRDETLNPLIPIRERL